MNYTIDDASFSVWGLIQRVETRSTLLNHRRTMSLISHQIEDVTISHSEQAMVFAGFQYLSRFLPQVKRYTRLAATARNVYIFGVPDAPMPEIPNVNYVELKPTDALAKEWFLISSAANYVSALATQELTNITDPDHVRQFKGIWTFDKDVVSVLQMWIMNMLNVREFIPENDAYDRRRQVMTVTREIERLEKLSKENDYEEPLKRELVQLSASLKQEAIRLMGTA